MPLPLLLVGAAVIAGGYGVKKGIDAKDDFDRAERINDEARELYEEASEELEISRANAQSSLEELGETKFSLYERSLIPFVNAFSQIKNIDFKDDKIIEEMNLPSITKESMLEVQSNALEMEEVVSGGIAALGSGGVAGLAAYGGVGFLGTASTGTGIAGLSGAAATNATLAWLGGGSLATGGLGMAGGTAVLGGIVAGPVLAVGGMMLASKAEAAKEDAYSNLLKAEAAAEQMETASTASAGLQRRFDELNNVLISLNEYFSPLLENLEGLVERNNDYNSYSKEQRNQLFMTASLAKTIKNIMEAPVIDENGVVTKESRKVLRLGRDTLQQIDI